MLKGVSWHYSSITNVLTVICNSSTQLAYKNHWLKFFVFFLCFPSSCICPNNSKAVNKINVYMDRNQPVLVAIIEVKKPAELALSHNESKNTLTDLSNK